MFVHQPHVKPAYFTYTSNYMNVCGINYTTYEINYTTYEINYTTYEI